MSLHMCLIYEEHFCSNESDKYVIFIAKYTTNSLNDWKFSRREETKLNSAFSSDVENAQGNFQKEVTGLQRDKGLSDNFNSLSSSDIFGLFVIANTERRSSHRSET
jgi:hypothetical protein